MAIRKARTARQIAASRRNIVAAQRRSAQLRRGGAGKQGTTSFYGKGRKGRKAAKASKYGNKKDGLSIAQTQRRRQRSNRRKNVARTAIAGGVFAANAVAVYKQNPEVKRSVDVAAKRAKTAAKSAKTQYTYRTGVGRQIKKAQKRK